MVVRQRDSAAVLGVDVLSEPVDDRVKRHVVRAERPAGEVLCEGGLELRRRGDAQNATQGHRVLEAAALLPGQGVHGGGLCPGERCSMRVPADLVASDGWSSICGAHDLADTAAEPALTGAGKAVMCAVETRTTHIVLPSATI